ncbi:MAG: L-threonylcarbamoyladenylate synthase [Cyanobacteria bacterium]|nr:L-threonylcarbamoyladenylate synthase [Cyanobacteriota bacterium]
MKPSHSAMVLDPDALAAHLLDGGAAVIPTDTVPGLAILPVRAGDIWQLKRRPQDKPLILMGTSVEALLSHARSACRDDAVAMAQKYWPGALTLVVPAEGQTLASLNPHGTFLGLRIPNCRLSRDLLSRTGPLATSSANPSGQPAAMTPEDAAAYFPEIPQLGPQPWSPHSGQASTVIRWQASGRWQLLRQGAVMPVEISESV